MTERRKKLSEVGYGLTSLSHLFTVCGEWGGAESRGNGARPVE